MILSQAVSVHFGWSGCMQLRRSINIHTYIHTYRQTDRQTDRQTRHTHTHTHIYRYICTHIHGSFGWSFSYIHTFLDTTTHSKYTHKHLQQFRAQLPLRPHKENIWFLVSVRVISCVFVFFVFCFASGACVLSISAWPSQSVLQ